MKISFVLLASALMMPIAKADTFKCYFEFSKSLVQSGRIVSDAMPTVGEAAADLHEKCEQAGLNWERYAKLSGCFTVYSGSEVLLK